MYFNYFLFIVAALAITIDFVLCLEVISDREIVENSYDVNRRFRSLGDDPWHDPVCEANNEQKNFICRQITEAINITVGKEDICINDYNWECEYKLVRVPSVFHISFHALLLKCPVGKNETTGSYYVLFSQYKNMHRFNKEIEVHGFIENNTEITIHRYFKDVKLSF